MFDPMNNSFVLSLHTHIEESFITIFAVKFELVVDIFLDFALHSLVLLSPVELLHLTEIAEHHPGEQKSEQLVSQLPTASFLQSCCHPVGNTDFGRAKSLTYSKEHGI